MEKTTNVKDLNRLVIIDVGDDDDDEAEDVDNNDGKRDNVVIIQ